MVQVTQELERRLAEERLAPAALRGGLLLSSLIDAEAYIGEVYTLKYEEAFVQIHDTYRRRVGGIPALSFLIATRLHPAQAVVNVDNEESSIILLRVSDHASLPHEQETERIRVENTQRVTGANVFFDNPEVMDATTHQFLSYAGLRCRVMGTFYVINIGSENAPEYRLKFGSDISNYYPNQGLKVYKPRGNILERIVNYRDPSNRVSDSPDVIVGHVRYASTQRLHQQIDNVEVNISPGDMLGQKTALFGMTRSGKSNTTKVILKSIFSMRWHENPVRVGQIVFDPNGEYANENEQDANTTDLNPNAVKNVWRGAPRDIREEVRHDVVTYGITPHPLDPNRRLMLLNFYLAENLQAGKEIINNIVAEKKEYDYLRNFMDVNFDAPDEQDHGEVTRYQRRILCYRALLNESGFRPPADLRPALTGLFSAALRNSLRASENADFHTGADLIENRNISWDGVGNLCKILRNFVKSTEYGVFNHAYMGEHEGRNWADDSLQKILEVFFRPNGPRIIGRAALQHNSNQNQDYSTEIYEHLRAGRLVIVDQSSGNEELNKANADRVMAYIYNMNKEQFRRGEPCVNILVYVEEAHYVLPSSKETDLSDIWVRTAKDGAKYKLGLVYATQEVSSIQQNILRNTANWFIGHLNNTDETRELRKFYDFADFEKSILRAQDKGFLRMKTLSNPYIVPVQIERFQA